MPTKDLNYINDGALTSKPHLFTHMLLKALVEKIGIELELEPQKRCEVF